MKKLLRNAAVVVVCVGTLLIARTARTEQALGLGGGFSGTSGTISTTATTVGAVVVLVLFVTKSGPFAADGGTTTPGKTSGPTPGPTVTMNDQDTAKMAELYLRDLGPSLAQDLAAGNGAVVNDWAKGLKLPAGHDARLGNVLHANRAELLELAAQDKLTQARAVKFFERVAELIHSDAVLDADVATLSI